MRRVNCQRCEHWQNLIEKIAFQPAYLFGRKLMLLMYKNTSIAQIGEQIGKRFLLIIHQRICNLGHTLQLLGRGQVILTFNLDACICLPDKAGHPHHEKLIEIAGRNRQKAQALQNRMMRIGRLLQHTLVERKPRQFAVYEPFLLAVSVVQTFDFLGFLTRHGIFCSRTG